VELFGILFSVPGAFVASLIYCLLLARVVTHIEPLRRVMWKGSLAVVLAFAVEVVLLLTMGPAQCRAIFGLAFYVAHLALFILVTPAVANLLVLWRPGGLIRWYWAVPICTVVGVGLGAV
jgi:hypothetical protein